MKKRMLVFCILIIFVLSIPVYAGVPMTTVEASVNRVLDVLRDAKLKSPAAKEKKKEKETNISFGYWWSQTVCSRKSLTEFDDLETHFYTRHCGNWRYLWHLY